MYMYFSVTMVTTFQPMFSKKVRILASAVVLPAQGPLYEDRTLKVMIAEVHILGTSQLLQYYYSLILN